LASPKVPFDLIASDISRNRFDVCASAAMHSAYVSRGRISGSSEKGRVLGNTYSGKTSTFEGVKVVTSMRVWVRSQRGRADDRDVVLEHGDEVRDEAVEAGLIGEVVVQSEEDIERSEDGCRSDAIA
jgi:hypothetical protein